MQKQIARQVFAHAQGAPGQVAFELDHEGPKDAPQQHHAQALERRHPAVPTGAGGKGGQALNPLVPRQQAKGMATIGVPDHPDWACPLRLDMVEQGRQIQPCPVQIVHAKAAQARGPRQPHTAIVEGPDLDALAGGKARKVTIKVLRHAGRTGNDEAAFRLACRWVLQGAEAITVSSDELQGLREEIGF